MTSQQLQLIQRSPLELLVIPHPRIFLTVSDPSERRSSEPSNAQKDAPIQVGVLGVDFHAVFGQRVDDEPWLAVSVEYVEVRQCALDLAEVLVGVHDRVSKDRIPWVRVDRIGRRRRRKCRRARGWLDAWEGVGVFGLQCVGERWEWLRGERFKSETGATTNEPPGDARQKVCPEQLRL